MGRGVKYVKVTQNILKHTFVLEFLKSEAELRPLISDNILMHMMCRVQSPEKSVNKGRR